jgi:hypothetical protein
MSATRTSFWRDARDLYVLYVIAGVATIPAGLVYAILAANNLERWWTAIPLLAFAVVSALLAWSFCERRWFSIQSEHAPPAPSILVYEMSPLGARVVPAPAAAVAFVGILTLGSAVNGITVQASTDIKSMAGTETAFFHHNF